MMNNIEFKYWLILNENVEQNFDVWFKTLLQYSSKVEHKVILQNIFIEIQRERDLSQEWKDVVTKTIGNKTWTKEQNDKIDNLLKIDLSGDKRVIKNILKSKGLENFNWFSFCIGYMSVKSWFQPEDLDLAIEVTKQRISRGDLPKREIGEKGWISIGYFAINHVNKYLEDQQKISKRQLEKMKKAGLSLSEDENLIKLVLNENNIKIYHLPAVISDDSVETIYKSLEDKETIIRNRHLLLCKYGMNTKWCTANPSGTYHKMYVANNIYIVHENDEPLYQFTSCRDKKSHQFMDTEDNHLEKVKIDVFNLLFDHLRQEIECYKLGPILVYWTMKGEKNVSEEQAIKVLKKLKQYHEIDKYFSGRQRHNLDNSIFDIIEIIGLKKFIETIGKDLNNNIVYGILIYFIVKATFKDKDYKSFNSLPDLIYKIKEENPNIILDPQNIGTVISVPTLNNEHGLNVARKIVLTLGVENLNSIDIEVLEKLSDIDMKEIRGNESRVMTAIAKKFNPYYLYL